MRYRKFEGEVGILIIKKERKKEKKKEPFVFTLILFI